MGIQYHFGLTQGTDEWFEARRGILTASEMDRIITAKTMSYSNSKEEKTHLFDLMAQRITGYVEPSFQSFAMQRGKDEELDAKILYNEKFAPVTDCGFITNDRWGFKLGYSPDGLVGDDGQIECKSRMQKYQVQTIIGNELPDEFKLQVQTGLLITERPWCDFISYCGGMPMFTHRVFADKEFQQKIETAAKIFHEKFDVLMARYYELLADDELRLIPTERKPYDQEIYT